MASIKREFTYDVIHRDSFPKQFLIRFADRNDKKEDTFDTLEGCKKSLGAVLKMDIFVSIEVLSELFN